MSGKEDSDEQEYWQIHGWQQSRQEGVDIYTGMYVVETGEMRCEFSGAISVQTVPGVKIGDMVVSRPQVTVSVMIQNPPAELQHHPHGACFQLISPEQGWFMEHFIVPPGSVNDAIVHVETVLAESLFPAA